MVLLRTILIVLFFILLAAMAVADWYSQTIDDRFSLMIVLLGIMAVWIFPEVSLASRIIGIGIPALPMLFAAAIVPGAFGGGDIKLMAACGWLLGWRNNLSAFIAGIFVCGVYCVIMLAEGKMTRKTCFAFGPFLALGFYAAVIGTCVLDVEFL